MSRKTCLLHDLIENLKKKLSSYLVLLQCDVEINIVAVIAEFQADGRISVMIPAGSVSNCANFEPDGPTFCNAMEIVQYMRLISASEVVQVVQEHERIPARKINDGVKDLLKIDDLSK